MTLRKFNDDFVKYRPEPQVTLYAIVIKPPYCGSGGRWYVDVNVVNKDLLIPIYDELREKCPGTFVEGYMKIKIPIMKGVYTYVHKYNKSLADLQNGDAIQATIACAGMFNLKGVWKPSWKLKVLEV